MEFRGYKKAEKIKRQIPKGVYGNYKEFEEIKNRCYRLYDLTKTDNIPQCNIWRCKRCEFLINKEEIYLIDWEYGGYGNSGFDLGSYICGGEHTIEDIDRILFKYIEKNIWCSKERFLCIYCFDRLVIYALDNVKRIKRTSCWRE